MSPEQHYTIADATSALALVTELAAPSDRLQDMAKALCDQAQTELEAQKTRPPGPSGGQADGQ